jgi:hypothetical protein
LPDPVSPATITTWWSLIAQLCRIAEVRDRGAALGYPLGGAVDVFGQLGDGLVAGALVAQAVRPVDTPGQPVLVGQHQLGQGAAQVSERGQRGRLSHWRRRVEEDNPVVPTLLGPPGFPGGPVGGQS